MLLTSIGAVGLTAFRRSQLKETHDQVWKEMKRAQHRLRVSAQQIDLVENGFPPTLSDKSNDDGHLAQFSVELLCGCLSKEQCDREVPCLIGIDLVRLNWANRSALKGRVALLNSRSPYLDQLLQRAVREELVGFALYGTGEDPLHSTEATFLLKRIEDALQSANAAPIPIWLIYGSAAQEIAKANAIRINAVEEEPGPTDLYFLPGGQDGMYETCLPDSVVVPSAQLASKVAGVFDTITWPLWVWSDPNESRDIKEIAHTNQNSITVCMDKMPAYVRVR